MPRFRCNFCSRRLARPPLVVEFESDDDYPQCPNAKRVGRPCRASRAHGLVKLCDVHFLAFHPEGPILAPEGPCRIPCQPDRDHMATPFEITGEYFSATSRAEAVTCPRCKGSDVYKKMMELYAPLLKLRRVGLRPRVAKGKN